MNEINNYLSLYQPDKFGIKPRCWVSNFCGLYSSNNVNLSWDTSAILSVLSFGYIVGSRTLFSEIRRQPWMTSITDEGELQYHSLPNHGLNRITPKQIGSKLHSLLKEELLLVTKGKDDIYILLSGGLDSRILALIVQELYREGKISNKPIAITWGMTDSRDVLYAKELSKILNIDFLHYSISAEDVWRNIRETAIHLGSIVSPIHLHALPQIDGLPQDSLILAASYGDSIGRAEFNGKHVLELSNLKPNNRYRLLKDELIGYAVDELEHDLLDFRNRFCNSREYICCELEMYGHYMRGVIASSMNYLNSKYDVYQIFTNPKVYSYMWSIHPSFRTDDVYYELLKQLKPNLSQFPWARSGKALRGITYPKIKAKQSRFHQYSVWVSEILSEKQQGFIDISILEQMDIFNIPRLKSFIDHFSPKSGIIETYTITWLASLCEMKRQLDSRNMNVQLLSPTSFSSVKNDFQGNDLKGKLAKYKSIYNHLSSIRKKIFYLMNKLFLRN